MLTAADSGNDVADCRAVAKRVCSATAGDSVEFPLGCARLVVACMRHVELTPEEAMLHAMSR